MSGRRFVNKEVVQKLCIGEKAGNLVRPLLDYRESGMTVVLTCGCFDLLHVGHARLLRAAADLGDLLVVGLNEDFMIQNLKGRGRPIRPLAERAELVASLQGVSFVTSFRDPDPRGLIERLKPDVYVKGADYAGKPLPESDTVTKNGGQVVFAPYTPDHSTTALIRRLKED